MPLRATHFVESWIIVNVNPMAIAAYGDTAPTAEMLALQCQEEAAKAGVPIAAIVEAYGSLEDRMRRALKLALFPANSSV